MKRRNDVSVQELREATTAGESAPSRRSSDDVDVQAEIAKNMAAAQSRSILRIRRTLDAAKDESLPTNFFDIPTVVTTKPSEESGDEKSPRKDSVPPAEEEEVSSSKDQDDVSSNKDDVSSSKDEVSSSKDEVSSNKDEVSSSKDDDPRKRTPLFASAPPAIVQTPMISTPFKRRGENVENENSQPVDSQPVASSLPPMTFGGLPDSGDRASTRRPTSFPGEEDEDLVYADFSITLLKCVNTSPPGEKTQYKYLSQGQGCVRVLKDKTGGRLVVRQTGTWKLLLNSPIEVVDHLETQVSASSTYLLKFTAVDTLGEDQKLYPYCLRFGDVTSRDECEKAIKKVKL